MRESPVLVALAKGTQGSVVGIDSEPRILWFVVQINGKKIGDRL